jgi:hypothetical protein
MQAVVGVREMGDEEFVFIFFHDWNVGSELDDCDLIPGRVRYFYLYYHDWQTGSRPVQLLV